ncbi:WD40 repeat domain-containing protein [Chamaesiphon minutus]|uniref:WD40 repeat-containing protein n=1 Tax=Chamaesiphon minutus (strain ATCC 27169 / PCC 6605) TaxID=1173020 RepID=K9UNX0_CHAP6|nr:WD40 repeat-containing protein [Chamaesiphon minutus]AFY95884.1 WD40 repeat-containing protein [Chamaesiphon minutus PCC 6605]
MTENSRSELELVWQGQLNDLVTAVACAPDGRGWAASSAAGEAVWNAGLDEVIPLLAPDNSVEAAPTIAGLAFSADSRWLAAGGRAGQLCIWNCEDLQLPPQLAQSLEIGAWIERLVWNPNSLYLAVSTGLCTRIWDIRNFTQIATWEFNKSSIFDLAWHPAGDLLAVAGYKGVYIRSIADPTAPSQRIEIETASIRVNWSDDGRYLAIGNLDRTLTIIDSEYPDNRWTLQGCPGKIRQLSWMMGTPNPCLVVASGNTIVLWHLSPDASMWEGQLLEGHQGIIEVAIPHPHLPILASGSTDGYVCLWSANGDVEQILSERPIGKYTTLGWHSDGLDLLTGSQSGSLGIWIIPA